MFQTGIELSHNIKAWGKTRVPRKKIAMQHLGQSISYQKMFEKSHDKTTPR